MINTKKEIVTKPDWSRAKQYIEGSIKSRRVMLAFQILVGKEICALRQLYNVQNGKPTNLFHGEIGAWPQALKKELGISVATAWRYHAMWNQAKSRLKKLNSPDAEILRQIVELPPGEIEGKNAEILEKAVHKISDGQSQMEFMREDGVLKLPQGSGAKGGYHPRPENAPLVDPTSPAEVARLFIMLPYHEMIQRWDGHWAQLERKHLEDLLQGFEGLAIDLRKALKR